MTWEWVVIAIALYLVIHAIEKVERAVKQTTGHVDALVDILTEIRDDLAK